MVKVILDANFLIYCAENKVDYVEGINEILGEGYELVVPSLVIGELEKIAEKASKLSDRNAAKLALSLLAHNKVKRVEFRGTYADEAILKNARGNIVATLDLGLRKNLESSRVIVIKGVKKIAFE